ncbi:uncharacterized protein LOC130903570 [Diorhabda carinulata]|uniref:uncharacterized protein LOC130903570 n=1 Tax=Diorhabda carinulata TaxID=1163345 RepID=UPI0025A2BA3C|nr:uncharacterized protein LOC130903570 [Diorhabda carinulata]
MAIPNKSLRIIIISIILVIISYKTTAKPADWHPKHYCEVADATKREMCQRCAKQTKSSLVYPMCCNEEDEVHSWCYKYINYGKMI